jgi:hypothetical protein
MPSEQDELVGRLRRSLDDAQKQFEPLDQYYNAEQRLVQLGLAVPPDLQGLITIVNWPRIAVDTIEHRLDVEGFRLPGAEQADERLWSVWQANDLDEESQLAHLDALIFGRSYVTVSSADEGEEFPLVAVESPLELIHQIDPRTRRLLAALKVWREEDSLARVGETRETLYLPDETIWFESTSGSPRRVIDRDEH